MTSDRTTSARPVSTVLGTIAVVALILGVVLGALLTLSTPLLYRAGGGTQVFGVLSAVGLVARGVLGLGAMVLGLIGLLLGRPRSALAAAGLGGGAVLLFDAIAGAMVPVLYSVL